MSLSGKTQHEARSTKHAGFIHLSEISPECLGAGDVALGAGVGKVCSRQRCPRENGVFNIHILETRL